jgi:hypothetical protein
VLHIYIYIYIYDLRTLSVKLSSVVYLLNRAGQNGVGPDDTCNYFVV